MGFRKLNLLSEFQDLERSLLQLLPKSSQMINLVRLSLLQKFPKQSSNNFYISYDDDEGDKDSLMIDPCKLFIVCVQIPNIFSTHCIITLTPDAISSSMIAAFDTLIDWGSVTLFSQTRQSSAWAPLLEQLCKKHEQDHHKTTIITPGRFFTLDPNLALDYTPPKLPNDLKIVSLEVKHAPQVIQNWYMAQPHSLEPVRDAIECFPSIRIYAKGDNADNVDDAKGDAIISSAILSTMGLLNIVYTEEAWRRHGLGLVTVRSLAKRATEELGLLPCAEIDRGNAKSEAMLEKAGFRQVFDTVWFYYNDKIKNDDK